MIRALKAAFLLRVPVQGLGHVPFNLVGVACFGLLGLANPGFWFAGAGLETLYLAALSTHPRFQRWAQAQGLAQETMDVEEKRGVLLEQLNHLDRLAVERLSATCQRIRSLWEAGESIVLQSNERALRDLQWLYLKLLLARQHVLGSDSESDERKLRADTELLERDLATAKLSPAARESKSATLQLLRKRVQNCERRRQSLDEIASDLARIEAQVALVLDNTSLEGTPAAVSADLDLASRLLDDSYFGASAADIAALDAAYSQPQPATRVSE